MRVSLTNTGTCFSVEPGQSVLDAALAAGLNLPHSCKGGNCGACRARLLEGEIAYPHGRPLGLSDAEVAQGSILLCQARARTDLLVEPRETRSAVDSEVKRLPCRIQSAERVSHDVVRLMLRLPAAEPLSFEPGQYVDVMLSGGRRRSFSIASPPHDARPLELHVRRVTGGEFTETVFGESARNTLLTIEGPLGQFVYRSSDAPMLLIGGGTGLAPLLSIIRHVVENGLGRELRLYWGVRGERDLYADAALRAIAARPDTLHYVPVLSEPAPHWTGRRGLVHEVASHDTQDLGACDVYAAGPPAMVAALRRTFAERGLPESRLYFDSFDYAPDALDRQRSNAATKS